MNKIIKIEEVHDVGFTPSHSGDLGMSEIFNVLIGIGYYDGYKVESEKDVIYVLINNGQYCCENWGYFSTEDDLGYYTGAELIDIELTDLSLTTENIDEIKCLDEGGVQFVTFKTSKGIFQLAVYNAHNGYYGHGIFVIKNNEIMTNKCL